jgi:hypothetical protein
MPDKLALILVITMNEQQLERSERIASKLLRGLAIIGLVAVLALATWVVVQGIRLLPNAGDNVTAAVSAVRGIFGAAPEDSISFDLDARTLAAGEAATISVTRTGITAEAESYAFRYACGSPVAMLAVIDGVTTDLGCGIYYPIEDTSFEVTPSETTERFTDVELTVRAAGITDTTLVTIVNTDIAGTDEVEDDLAQPTPATNDTENSMENSAPEVVAEEPAAAPAPVVGTAPVVSPRPTPTTTDLPADLVVNIENTGVVVDVAGKDTFYTLSPLPTDRVAAVVFTVTNRGGQESGVWAFRAELPIEGDDDYIYTSPAQQSLMPGMGATFTLSFDEVLEEDEGLISVEVIPTDTADRSGNNIDAVKVEIDVK